MELAAVMVMSLFALYGAVSMVMDLYKVLMHRGVEDKYVVMTVKRCAAEGAVRCVLRENPDSEVIVINRSVEPDTAEVLRRLERDFEQVHVV